MKARSILNLPGAPFDFPPGRVLPGGASQTQTSGISATLDIVLRMNYPVSCSQPGFKGYHESRRCSRDTYPESYITKSISILVYEDYTFSGQNRTAHHRSPVPESSARRTLHRKPLKRKP